jgi:hypothetical protein
MNQLILSKNFAIMNWKIKNKLLKILKNLHNRIYIKLRLDSHIVVGIADRIRLLELCGFTEKVDRNWRLLYRATRDGFKAFDFHKACDEKLKYKTSQYRKH